MNLSTGLLRSMGFESLSPDEVIEARFYSVHSFEVRGFTIDSVDITIQRSTAHGTDYTLAVGRSVNEIAKAILQDNLVDDEDSWAKERKCTPPYALLHFGPTALHRVVKGHRKHENGSIITYDAFSPAREELRSLEDKVLPSIETALTCAFSTDKRRVRFQPIERTVYGLTPEGIDVHDVRFTARGTGYVSSPITSEDIAARLQVVTQLATSLDSRASEFFQRALRDDDDLKRFLYYFLAIEIDVHRVFRRTRPSQHLANGMVFDSRVSASLAGLLESRRENWTSLADRYVWCVVSTWTHLSDLDIDEFRRLKNVRDAIAHGDIAKPDPASVVAVENLARKIRGGG